MNPLNGSQSTVGGLAWKRYSRQTPLRDVAPALNGRASLPGRGHAERALQASWWQEHGAAHDGGPRAQQASKLETRALFAGSQGGTVARPGGNTCAPLSARPDLKAPRSRGRIRTTPDHLSHWHRCQWQGRRGLRAQGRNASTGPIRACLARRKLTNAAMLTASMARHGKAGQGMAWGRGSDDELAALLLGG
jgi:hypothetical protein